MTPFDDDRSTAWATQLIGMARAMRLARPALPRRARASLAKRSEDGPRYRPYAAGDDCRAIDWNICARRDELVCRQLPPIDDRPVYVLLDASQSMATGNPRKWERAIRFAALVAATALVRLDRVAVLAFADGVIVESPPIRGIAQCLSATKFVDQLGPRGSCSDLAAAASWVARRRRPGIAVVIGDFLAPESYSRGLDRLRRSGNTVCAIHLCAAEDARPWILGNVALCDSESGERLADFLSRSDQIRYRAAFEAFCESVRRSCRRLGIDYVRNWETTPWRRAATDAMRLLTL